MGKARVVLMHVCGFKATGSVLSPAEDLEERAQVASYGTL